MDVFEIRKERAHPKTHKFIPRSIVAVYFLLVIENLLEFLSSQQTIVAWHYPDRRMTRIQALSVENVYLMDIFQKWEEIFHKPLRFLSAFLNLCFDEVRKTCVKLSALNRINAANLKPL